MQPDYLAITDGLVALTKTCFCQRGEESYKQAHGQRGSLSAPVARDTDSVMNACASAICLTVPLGSADLACLFVRERHCQDRWARIEPAMASDTIGCPAPSPLFDRSLETVAPCVLAPLRMSSPSRGSSHA